MRTLFVATAAFAALMIGAPIGKAHAADDSAVCYSGIKVASVVFDQARANVKGNNDYDRSMLRVEMSRRFEAITNALGTAGGEHAELAQRGRTPTVSCAEIVKRAVAYMVGDPALLNAAMNDPVVDRALCDYAKQNHVPTKPGACE